MILLMSGALDAGADGAAGFGAGLGATGIAGEGTGLAGVGATAWAGVEAGGVTGV